MNVGVLVDEVGAAEVAVVPMVDVVLSSLLLVGGTVSTEADSSPPQALVERLIATTNAARTVLDVGNQRHRSARLMFHECRTMCPRSLKALQQLPDVRRVRSCGECE